MGGNGWKTVIFNWPFLLLVFLILTSHRCLALHDEGIDLLEFSTGAISDSDEAFPGSRSRKLVHRMNFRNAESLDSDSSSFQAIIVNGARHKIVEAPKNLVAAPAPEIPSTDQFVGTTITYSSGAFSALADGINDLPYGSLSPTQHTEPLSVNTSIESRSQTFASVWKCILVASGACTLLILSIVVFYVCKYKKIKAVSPWKTGLSGQLRKAFSTGVPKLNRDELVTACEDFSNIISTSDGCVMYKGTLSDGVEIAVATTTIASAKEWSKSAEKMYRRTIETMSRMNHKNFINLLGYCEEEEPFTRMMVLEYAPNGSLFEHLHVKEMEHLDWNSRMRIIMGIAYCLQNMHELNPPVAVADVNSNVVILTDDYAAKIADTSFWKYFIQKSGQDESTRHSTSSRHSVSSKHSTPAFPDLASNVFCFGVLLLEVISGKLPHTDEYSSKLNWANEHLKDRSINNLADPTLKSFKANELNHICDVIIDCVQPEPRKRPTMKEVVTKLREVIVVSPEAATPRLSPLWWAELEILSEAS